MKKIIRTRAVIFDMDGVITDTMPYHFIAWCSAMRGFGIKFDCNDIYRREGQPGRDTLNDVSNEYSLNISQKIKRDILNNKETLFKKIVRRKFIKGSLPFLRSLKKKGLLLGLVTGTARHEVKKILHKNIYGLFDCIVTGDEVARGKPNPMPFITALKKLRITKKDAFVIENAPFGISAAKRAGLFCVALETSLGRRYLKEADMVFKSFNQLQRSLTINNK
ncbi:MAG: HAD family phosphatase [Candidatus Gygaella obscura]|nr:HAD family phosphatase [Candidatus Gygaella obscura]